ncbi:MAG: DUF4190 domain-containing protein [Flavobacteriales bacterium]
MNLKQLLLGSGILVFLAGCSSTNDVVSKGPIQKRKYHGGWYVDLNRGHRHNAAQVPERLERRKWSADVPEVVIRQELPVAEPDKAPAEPATAKVMRSKSQVIEERPVADLTASVAGPVLEDRAPAIVEQLARSERIVAVAPAGDEGTNEKTNGMAIAGFVCSFFIPLLGIIFSAIALGQIRRRGGRGHGLAVAGLIISIATILLVIALL